MKEENRRNRINGKEHIANKQKLCQKGYCSVNDSRYNKLRDQLATG